jgi:hypothetical protein
MKLSISFPFLLVSLVLGSGVTAESVMRYLFNNGIGDKDLFCDVTDWAKIDPIFEHARTARRNLRQVNTVRRKRASDFEMDVIGRHNIKERELQYTASQCRNFCAGQVKGTYCRATGCTWYIVRRNLARNMSERDLQETWCTITANSINAQLDNLVSTNQVSNPCKLLLNAPRKIECLNDIVFGEIQKFNVWSADTGKVVKDAFELGYKFCSSVGFNFEAQTNPCVKSVLSVLTGPNGLVASTTESIAPYTAFGSLG